MNEFFRLKYFISYQWRAKTKYYLHSPFVYQFYLNVLEGEEDANIAAINKLRHQLASDTTIIEINDYGTGNASTKKVCHLESKVAVRKKYGQVLYRLVKYCKPHNILELGTSIGLSSAYMAMADLQANITTLEGAPALIKIAEQSHKELGIKSINIYKGNFDELLPRIIKAQATLDLVFFDGNHQKEATLRYFNLCLEKAGDETIFVFDDIYWSQQMNEAWSEIKMHPRITLALDIFQFGICFFRKGKLAKEEFVLRY